MNYGFTGRNIYNVDAIAYARRKKARKAANATRPKKAAKNTVKRATVPELQKAYAITKKYTYPEAPIYRPGLPGKQFYITREWRELRYSVFKKYCRVCQCCGATDTMFHVDHIKPRSKYPELELDFNNLQILCEACNIGKSNLDMTDWR
jgi:hypothetical protein